MSGASSSRNLSRIGRRARTLLMFQEATVRVGMRGVYEGRMGTATGNKKTPAPGAGSGGQPSVLTRGQLRVSVGQQGENPNGNHNCRFSFRTVYLSPG